MHTAQVAQYHSVTLIIIVNYQGHKINTRSCMHENESDYFSVSMHNYDKVCIILYVNISKII